MTGLRRRRTANGGEAGRATGVPLIAGGAASAGAAVSNPEPLVAWADVDPDWQARLEADARALVRGVEEGKRALMDAQEAHAADVRRLILSVIDAVDAFERVFANIETRADLVTTPMKGWLGNFRTIHRRLVQILGSENVVVIESADDQFDPEWQEVGELIDDSSQADGTVVRQFKKGYVRRGELLRRAQVAVVHHGGGVDDPSAQGET